MRKFAQAILFALVLISGSNVTLAATVDATFSFMDITSRTNQVTSLTISGLCPIADNGSSQVFGSPRTFSKTAYPGITNGSFTISNIVPGFGVQVVFADGWTTYSNQYAFPSGLTGAVSAITYKSVNNNRTNGGCPYQASYFTPTLNLALSNAIVAIAQANSSGGGSVSNAVGTNTVDVTMTGGFVRVGTNYGTHAEILSASNAVANQVTAASVRTALPGLVTNNYAAAVTLTNLVAGSITATAPGILNISFGSGTINGNTATFGSVSGDGSALTSLSAANISGIIPIAQLPNNVVTTNGASDITTNGLLSAQGQGKINVSSVKIATNSPDGLPFGTAANLTAAAATNGVAILTNSTAAAGVVATVASGIYSIGTNNPAQTNATLNFIANQVSTPINLAGGTNLPVLKGLTSTNLSFVATKNADGTTNIAITLTNLAGISSGGVDPTNVTLSYLVKPVGSYTDHVSVFTNLQECFNVISNASMSLPGIYTNGTWVFTEPSVAYAVHLSGDAICYTPPGFQLNIKRSCSVFLSGDQGARIMGDSNVLIFAGVTPGGNSIRKADIGHINFVAKNAAAKTMMVFAYAQTLDFHDNWLGVQSLISSTNYAIGTPIYGSSDGTNTPGLIGFVGFGEHGLNFIQRNAFDALAVCIVGSFPHTTIRDNELGSTSAYRVNGAGAQIVSNLWSAADQSRIFIPYQNGFSLPVFGWECALKADIVLGAYSGVASITGNHMAGGVYYDENNSPSLGPISIFYNSIEGGGTQNLITSSNFVLHPTADYWGNTKGSESGRLNQNVNVFSHDNLTTISNLFLSGFTNSAGALDATLNGTYRLKSASANLNSSANYSTATAIWTNAANTDSVIFLNPASADNGAGIYTSNTASGNNGFFAVAAGTYFNGYTTMPIIPTDFLGFFNDNAGASAAPGNYFYGTNVNFAMSPQSTIANFQVMDGLSRMMSNGVTFNLIGGVWTNAYTGNFFGNGLNLTNLNVTNLTGVTLPVLNGGNLTNLQTILVQTNFGSGQLYTNNYGSGIVVMAKVANTVAAVTGASDISLRAIASPANGGWTNSIAFGTTVAVTIAMTYTNVLSIFVPTNAVYCFTNLSTGAGNTANVVGGQIKYP